MESSLLILFALYTKVFVNTYMEAVLQLQRTGATAFANATTSDFIFN